MSWTVRLRHNLPAFSSRVITSSSRCSRHVKSARISYGLTHKIDTLPTEAQAS